MDTRHFLLAEHYDSLGLYKVADSLDTIRISQFPGQPEVERDPHKVVVKPKPVAPKKNVVPKPDVIEQTIGKLEPALKVIEPVLGPVSAYFTISEINNLSKQALDIHALQKLTEIAKNGIVKSSQTSYLQTLANNSKISPEISQILKQAINKQIPTLKEINALRPQMPNIGGSAANFISKMKAFASKNPAEAKIAENVTEQLGKKVGLIKTLSKTVPIAFIMLNALTLYPEAKKYFAKISSGDINEIWDQADTRAKFVIFLADIISFFTSFFPPLAPVTSALIAISAGYQGGMYAYDKYQELSGEKEIELAKENFVNSKRSVRPVSIYSKYILNKDKDGKITSHITMKNFWQNIDSLVREYTVKYVPNQEAAYALRTIVYPEILRAIYKAWENDQDKLGLKTFDMKNLPALRTGKAISEKKDKNGNWVTRQLAPAEFILDPLNPKNFQAAYEFETGLRYIVNDINNAYEIIEHYKGK